MLIEIGKDIVEAAEKKDAFACQVLEYLGMAYRNCKHIVFADKLLMAKIISLNTLSDDAKNVFKNIQSVLVTEIFPMRDHLQFWVKLFLSGNSERQDHIVLMNLNDYKTIELYEESHLLAENIFDCKFYEQMGLYYLRENNLQWADISLFFLQGGGTPTCRVYHDEIIRKQHFCLAILDSDKPYPKSSKEGETYKLVKKEDSKAAKPCNCMFEQLKYVREIENLIPSSYLSRKYLHEFVVKKKVDLCFFDLKDGLMPKVLWNQEAVDYYKQLFAADSTIISEINRFMELKTGKNKEDYCSLIKDEKAIVSGLRDKIMENFLDDSPDDNISNMTPDPNGQRKEWNRIGKLVALWGCAPRYKATR